jgi:hypothetical protein
MYYGFFGWPYNIFGMAKLRSATEGSIITKIRVVLVLFGASPVGRWENELLLNGAILHF